MNAVTRRHAPSAAAFQHLGALMLVAVANMEDYRTGKAQAAQMGGAAIALCQALLMGGAMQGETAAALNRVAALMAGCPAFAEHLAKAVGRALEPLFARLQHFLEIRPRPTGPSTNHVLDWWAALVRLPRRFQSAQGIAPESLILLGLIAWAEGIAPRLDGPGGPDAACAIAGLIAEVAKGASDADQARMLAAIAGALPRGAWPTPDYSGRSAARGGGQSVCLSARHA